MKIIFILAALSVLHPIFSSGAALLFGVLYALTLGNPLQAATKKYTSLLLMGAVVGLGFGMDLTIVGKVGAQGIGYTLATILLTLGIGLAIGRILKVAPNSSLLITAGTAICGGSAIAAVSPAIGAKHEETSVALGTVFLLNSVALFLFPPVGHWLALDQTQFGLWSALGIHDTSSVVGATMQFGAESLAVGTTVKLARALWIAPLTLGISFFRARGAASTPIKFPYFILGFIAAAAVVTYIPATQPLGNALAVMSRRALVLTLFLIGANLNRETIRSVGATPLVQGVLLWILAAAGTLLSIRQGIIHL